MKLKNLERDIQIMEETLAKMKNLTKEVEDMDDQVDVVRNELQAPTSDLKKQPAT